MKRHTKILALFAVVVAVTTVATSAANPLRRSDQAVHRYLIENVPVGSTLEALESVAAQKGWRINGTWEGHTTHSDWGGIDGHIVAWVYLGGYRNFFQTDLDSFWAFDESGKLVDVVTRRMTGRFMTRHLIPARRRHLTNHWSERVIDKVPSSYAGERAAQLKR